jgi:hypothetical protein
VLDAMTFRLTLLIALAAAGCSESPRPRGDGKIAGDGKPKTDGGGGKTLTWTKQVLDVANAGKQSAIGAGGAVAGVAYFRELEKEVIRYCQAAGLTPAGDRPRPAQDLMYTHFDGSSWGAPITVEQTIGPTYGLSVTVAKGGGKVYVGYLGGELSKDECSSGDAIIASSADGKAFAKRPVSTKGPIGDTVGYWMSVALDSKGQDHAAHGDVRFGYYEQDGRAKASARYDDEVVVGGNGAGVYNSLVFDGKDRPVIAFFNPMQKGATGGVQLAVKEGASWTVSQLVTGSTSERSSLATDGKGRFGFAFYEPDGQALNYRESQDLAQWSQLKIVDGGTTHNGEFSSLAFDSKGNPGIAYYRCGRYGEDKCDPQQDALMYAYRAGPAEEWSTHEVDTGDASLCGAFSSLAFGANDQPLISYQCVQLDNKSGKFVATLKVARGAVE